MIPEVHLPARGLRSSTNHRANPLVGPLPERTEFNAAELRAIVAYLDVERSPRYKPEKGATFCNIYAYDYCMLAGVFLPRVWWAPRALIAITNGESVPVRYGETVFERNANSLHVWMEEHGASFGWRAAASLDQLQYAANAGQVAVITAIRKERSRSGHIACVVPGAAADVDHPRGCIPMQSQAGATNYCASTDPPGRWWLGAQFAAHGFWINWETSRLA